MHQKDTQRSKTTKLGGGGWLRGEGGGWEVKPTEKPLFYWGGGVIGRKDYRFGT